MVGFKQTNCLIISLTLRKSFYIQSEIYKMTTINTKIPDALVRQVQTIAESEQMTLDQFIALASQISSWNAGKIFAERAYKGDWKKAQEILAKATDVKAENFDEL